MKRKMDHKLDQAIGHLKQELGRGLEVPSLELEGRLQQLSGRLKEQGHQAKEELAQTANQLLDQLESCGPEPTPKEGHQNVQRDD